MDSIGVHQRPEEATRSSNKSCYWIAETSIGGQTFTARSRHGAPNELARVLVAAGIPDVPMHLYTGGLRGYLTIPSFHEAAEWSYRESASEPLRRVRWLDPAAVRAQIARTIAPKQGVNAPAATPLAPSAFGDNTRHADEAHA